MVRTRFAPSPTGYLHIGGVRTALFNWLYARKHAGQFVLRIDDTDAQRNVAEALEPILHGFRWLGLDWDEGPEVGGPHGPYYQSQRQEKHQQAVQVLLERGVAYRDYSTPEELAAERKAAEAEKKRFLYSRRWQAKTPEQAAVFEAEGRTGVVRLKMPREGVCSFHDHVRGAMEVPWVSEADHVIQRADGSCLYNLASVVDDHDMNITHVIRAQEHLSNTPRQIFIARGLGYDLPEYAHLPFVAEPNSDNKLSKRKLEQYLKVAEFQKVCARGQWIAERIGLATSAETFNPVIVAFYEQVGYLPHAVINFLLLVGWALDDRTEFFTREEMIRHFSLDRVNKAPARFNVQKLAAFQEYHMQQVPLDRKVEMVVPFLEKAGLVPTPADEASKFRVQQVVEHAAHRIVVAGDILDYDAFFLPDDQLVYDEQAFDKRIRKPPEALGLLKKCRDRLANASAFDQDSLEHLVQDFASAEGIKVNQIIHALRVAITGKGVGFGLYESLALLGQQSCLNRVDAALERG
jgi:glutamyl-tRNA synthetase